LLPARLLEERQDRRSPAREHDEAREGARERASADPLAELLLELRENELVARAAAPKRQREADLSPRERGLPTRLPTTLSRANKCAQHRPRSSVRSGFAALARHAEHG